MIKNAAIALSQGKKIKAVAGGTPGPQDFSHTKIINAPNLPGWNGKPLKGALQALLKTKVFLENDTALVGLGEAHFGAGKASGIMAYLTVSTGVGGVRIVDRHIDRNSMGFEVGHQIISLDGGKFRDLESFISGKATEKKYHKKPYKILDKKFWDEAAHILAIGLNNTIVHWSPDTVIIGGSMMKKIGIPIKRVHYHLNKILKIFPRKPKILKAKLGDLGGLHGAMIYLKQSLTHEGVRGGLICNLENK